MRKDDKVFVPCVVEQVAGSTLTLKTAKGPKTTLQLDEKQVVTADPPPDLPPGGETLDGGTEPPPDLPPGGEEGK